jgi:hypothetical protein
VAGGLAIYFGYRDVLVQPRPWPALEIVTTMFGGTLNIGFVFI